MASGVGPAFGPFDSAHSAFQLAHLLPEKREFFAYAPEKLESAQKLTQHKFNKQIKGLIKGGDWNGLISLYKMNRVEKCLVHDLLKSLYLQDIITMDELATAYFFLSPAIVDEQYEIIPFEHIENAAFKKLFDVAGLPSNLMCALQMNFEDMSRALKELFEGGKREKEQPIGIHLGDQTLTLVSAGLWKKQCTLGSQSPHYTLGLATSRKEMFQRMKQGKSDVALFDPDQIDTPIHGFVASSVLPYFHDSYHAYRRTIYELCKDFDRTQLFELTLKIEEFLGSLPSYVENLKNPFIVKYRGFKNNNDLVRYVLEKVCDSIADGLGEKIIKDCNYQAEKVFVKLIELFFNQAINIGPVDFKRCDLNACCRELNRALQPLKSPLIFKGKLISIDETIIS